MTSDSTQLSFRSPLEERHIDFLLEEEFASNSSFLPFFIELAWKNEGSHPFSAPAANLLPECFRSVTSLAGESDVLVIYDNVAGEKTALLIEDKIAAIFQKDQALRYKQRGDEGVQSGRWQKYWTCLVAPRQFANKGQEFDARVDIEDIAVFFEREATDARSSFKANMLRDSAAKQAASGIQIENTSMTELRHQYSELATQLLQNSLWTAEVRGKSFTQDSWFRFFHSAFGTSVKCFHKPLAGAVQVIYPKAAKEVLEGLHNSGDGSEGVSITDVGTLGVAVQFPVTRLKNYQEIVTADTARIVIEAVHGLTVLEEYLRRREDALHVFGMGKIEYPERPQGEEEARKVACLEAQLFGLMWSRAREFGSSVRFTYPDLSDLVSGKEQRQAIVIPGMAGCFWIVLRRTTSGDPMLFAESDSRIWGGGMRHEISFANTSSEEADLIYGEVSFDDWIETRLRLRNAA